MIEQWMRFSILATTALMISGCLDADSKKELAEAIDESGDNRVNQVAPPDSIVRLLEQIQGDETFEILQDESNEHVLVNSGNPYTQNDSFSLEFLNPLAYQVRVSDSSTCDGEWKSVDQSMILDIQEQNAKNHVYVQFRDPDFLLSDCHKIAVIHDTEGPETVFNPVPPQVMELGQNFQLGVNVSDAGIGITEIVCKYNGEVKDCDAGSVFDLEATLLGTNDFSVTATDAFGNIKTETIEWLVTNQTIAVNQDLEVSENNKVDILFVVDNSGSMSYEQQSMANRISNFMQHLGGLDWQIAVTTTDARDITLGDGRLIELTGQVGQHVLTSATPVEQAQTLLGNTLQRPEIGWGKEQGIKTTYRALERSLQAGTPNHQFVRQDSSLSVVVISDEDESDNDLKNDPQELLNYIDSQWQGQKNFSFHSIITIPDDSACLGGHGAKYGYRYQQLSQLTGAGAAAGSVIGSVCSTDYGSQLSGIGQAVRDMKKSVTLSCEPVLTNGHSVTVKKDGVPFAGGFTVEGVKIIFDDFLPLGQYTFDYHCWN